MKTFTFRYDPHPRKTTLNAIAKTQKSGKGEILDNEILCRSMEEMLKVMTKTRFKIFTEILESSPDSLTELAESLGKDLGNVMKDIQVLESLGLVNLERSKGKRGEKIKPIALYDRIVCECEPKRYSSAS